MKCAIVPAANRPWQVQEAPVPKPSANQVLIKIRASGMCFTDVHQCRGDLPGAAFPRILGHEPVGEIVEVGSAVTDRRVGDRVGVPWVQTSCGRCEWCLRGKPMFCQESLGTSVQLPGGHAEYMVAYSDAAVLLPEKLSYEQAAPIFCAGYTVWSGLRWASPNPGDSVAILGVGGLGHLAVQYAKAAGFTTIAISRSSDKDEMVRKLGADMIVRDGAGLAKSGGADVVLSTTNSTDAMIDSIQGLRPDGKLVAMGFDAKPLQISLGDLIMKRIQIIGSQQNDREYLFEALAFAAAGKVKVQTETYRLDEVQKAYERVENGKVRFRAVITL